MDVSGSCRGPAEGEGKTHDVASSRYGRHRPPGTICRCPAGRCQPGRARARPPPARHSAAGHVLHRRSSAGRGYRPGRAWCRDDHPLRDQHEGRRGGDENLVTAAAKAGSPHFVQPSIVGIDAMAAWGYVKAKLAVERIVENSGLPWTILRITQFYSYCFENSRKLAKFPLVARCLGTFVSSRSIPARSQPASSNSRLASPSAGPRTCRDRKYRAGRTCSAATWRPPISANGWSPCRYPEARPCATAPCSHRRGTPKGSEPGTSS